jgi:photosystem II stability/assembly factor-like uncharacterized protein
MLALTSIQGCKDPLEGDIPRKYELITSGGWRKVSSLRLQRISDIISFENHLLVVGDSGRIFRSTDDGRTWTEVQHSLKNSTFTLKNIGQKLLALQYFYPLQNRILHQADINTVQWVQMPNPTTVSVNAAFNLIVQDSRLFAVGGSSFSYSEDVGSSWKTIDMTRQALEVNGVAFVNNAWFVGTNYGVQISKDTGKTWRQSNTGIEYFQNDGVANSFTITPSTVIVNTSNGLFCSQDTGKTWQASTGWVVRGLLPRKYVVNMIRTQDFRLFSITGADIYRSINRGLSWQVVDSNNAPVNPYVLCLKENLLFAGTADSGLYRLPLR